MASHLRTSSFTSSYPQPSSAPGAGAPATDALEKTFFEEQREMLVLDIAQSLQNVLQNLNKLNRSLEEVIAVGNEFSPVEALWSQFENVMAKESGEEEAGEGQQQQQQGGGAGQGEEEEGEGQREDGQEEMVVEGK